MKACARVIPVAVAVLLGGWLLGCRTPAEEYRMGQRIEMGPYAFTVEQTEESQVYASVMGPEGHYQAGTVNQIRVFFRLLRDDTAPFTTDFANSFLTGMKLVDGAGNQFDVNPVPLSPVYRGGRQRSDEYAADIKLDPSFMGVRRPKEMGQHARDFRLIIDNPDPRSKQPRRISIALR